MKRILSVLFYWFSTTVAWATAEVPCTPDYWTGPSGSVTGSIDTYTFDNGNVYMGVTWYITHGSLVSYWASGTTYSVQVQWLAPGTGELSIAYDTDVAIEFGTKEIGITGAPTIQSPVTTFSITSTACSSSTITRASNPGSSVKWYWQTSSSGESTSNFGTTYTKTTSGSQAVYLRARLENSPFTWSPAVSAGTIVVYGPLEAAATATNGHVISNNQIPVPVSVSSVSGASGYKWYTDSLGTNPLSGVSGTSYSPSPYATKKYYVETMNGTCPSTTRKVVTAYVHPEAQLTSDDGSVNMGAEAELKVDNYSYDTYQWINAATNTAISGETGSTFLTGSTGQFRVRVTKGSAVDTTDVFTVGNSLGTLDMNYVVSSTLLVEGITDEDEIPELTVQEKSQTIQYFDGLGAPLQTVITQGSPLMKDIVQESVYDGFGREHKKYLPVVVNKNSGWYKKNLISTSTGAYSSIAADFYQNNAEAKIAQDAKPFTHTLFEASPANRPLKDFGAGADWADNNKAIEYSYRLNTHSTSSNDSAEKVIAWKIASGLPARQSALTGYVATNGYYANNQLTIKVVKDEEGNRVREYTNKQGQVILKKVQAVVADSSNLNSSTGWASTYYIYDRAGNLRFVLPPELSKIAHSSDTAAMNTTRLNNWAFIYTYDARKRMATKQVPGAGPVYMVYDARDRLVLTQDANQRTNKYWSFTKYDELNRPVLTGIKDTAVTVSQADMQAVVNAHYAKAWARLYEKYVGTASGNMHGYSNKSYPVYTGPTTTNDKNRYLSVTYYDNYNFKNVLYDSSKYSFSGSHLAHQESAFHKQVTGQVTGTKIKVLDGGVTGGNTWLVSVNYYDDDYRMVQNVSANYKGGIDRITNTYDFTGKVLKSKATHAENDVLWKDLSGVVMNGNMLKRTKASNGWDAGAVSTHTLPASTDGWIEFIVGETTTNRVIGFANNSVDNDYVQIDYAFYLNGSTLKVYETTPPSTNAALKYTASGALVPGEVLRIERSGTTIRYKRNGVQIYQSNTASSGALLADISMYSNTGFVTGVSASFEGSQHSVTRSFEYDHAGRVMEVWHRLDSEDSVLLVKNSYNELGQLVDKKLHSTDGESFKQSVDYTYNIRGWLTKMNESDLSGEDADAGRDLFGMQLHYNETDSLSNTPLYNGNISAIKWSNNLALGDTEQNAYVYSYDPMNRITASAYKEKKPTWTAATNYGNAETGFTYDLNGNIKTLQRNDRRASGWMDNLTYDYGSTPSNKLMKVTDAGDKTKGFIDIATASDDYAYDNNGNLIWDRNKGGVEVLTNGSFESGSSGWTVTNGSRLTFANNEVTLVTGGANSYLQQNVLVKSKPYVVMIDMERASGTLSVSLCGSASVALTSTGVHVFTVVSGTSGLDIQLTASTNFAGKIKSVSVKGVTVITYNFMNLPEIVTRAGDKQLQYIYDASGRKLRQEVSTAGALTKSTDYEGEYIYENDTLQFINHEEGRIIAGPVPASPDWEYQYHLKDHLGNVRMTFTSKHEADTAKATMETANVSDEQGGFLYYNEAVKINSAIFDHTNNGATNYSLRLTGMPNNQFGLAKSLSVMPGDTIKATVFAKYLESDTTEWSPGGFTTFMNTVRWGSPAGGVLVDGGLTGSTGGVTPPFGSLLTKGPGNEDGAPKAYLNYLLFDRDYNFLDGGFVAVTEDAREYGQDGAHEELNKELAITQAGYVYLYLSNDNAALGGNAVEVFFDDFTVEHVKSPVVQQDDYYPFGLAFNSYSGENTTPNKYKYNGMEEVKDLGLNWLTPSKYRTYDPILGRFMQIDPIIKEHESLYAWNTNNPIRFADPTGADSTQRANAIAKAQQYKDKNPGDSYPTSTEKAEGKFKGAPGEKVDCSGLVSQAIIAGGETDPVLTGEGTGVQRIAANLPKIGDKDNMSEVMPGTVVALNNTLKGELDPAKDFKHTGLITEVVKDKDGNITLMKMIDSGGTAGSGKSGPRESTLISGGKSQYWGDRINGFYKWDTKPDTGAKATNTAAAVTNTANSPKTNWTCEPSY
jgi:RHS repeat-associated protein